ncbi:MAG: DUF368 domain-containing protein [Candidatus Andersenbacteria bacterium]|nr:DUF368 domain-containing protein [Candidatus Andersenbacteria bacterium]
MDRSFSRSIRLFITGLSMGIADLIPGVSGGTIAFLSGIYEELLESIRIVSGKTLRLFLQGNIVLAVQSVPFAFLIPLLLGLGISIFSLANVLSWLLENRPIFVWSFFFGLVLASTFIVLKRVVQWDVSDKVVFVVSTLAAYFLVGAVPIETPTNLPFIFLSGAIAICAMILPGISGSFILLLLGKYQYILEAVTERNFLILGVFIVGCIVGLSLFARFLSWLFAHHHDISVAILAGIMLGSIRKIWPWKQVLETRINSHGEIVPLVEKNIIPEALDITIGIALVLAILAAAIVYYLERLHVVKELTQDISSTGFAAQHEKSLASQRHNSHTE